MPDSGTGAARRRCRPAAMQDDHVGQETNGTAFALCHCIRNDTLPGLWRFPRLLGSVPIVGCLCGDLEILSAGTTFPPVFVAWETDRGEDCAARERPGDRDLAGAVRGAVHVADMAECG